MTLVKKLENKYINEAGTVILPCSVKLSKYALDLYRDLNPEKFSNPLKTLSVFNGCLKEIEGKHNQTVLHEFLPSMDKVTLPDNKKVLLAFSGGLDSAYQALVLKDAGYEVILFHVQNMNFYTNGKEFQVVKEFSEYYGFPLEIAEFKQNTHDGPYKKFWKENSFKNTLLYSMMVDYCTSKGIKYISSGDDLRLDISDTVTGTNVADSKQVTLSFFNSLKDYVNIEFLPIKSEHGEVHKGERIKKLIEHDGLDLFYSCVNPGRFNQSNHTRVNEKFGVEMEKWNCGVCRKCAYHSLLFHYYLGKEYPKEFIDYCWTKICNGADYEFFRPDLPLEKRIQNLYDY